MTGNIFRFCPRSGNSYDADYFGDASKFSKGMRVQHRVPEGEIVVWLRSLGFGKYDAAFRENEIDETVLPSVAG